MATVTELRINGRRTPVRAEPDRMLLGVLRDDLDLTGSKYGCGEGRCGACTVMLDGKAVRSCITSVGDAAGSEITTVEGLEHDGKLHPLQAAFLDHQAFQCGFCTCGMIVRGVALLKENPHPTAEEVVKGVRPRIDVWSSRSSQAATGNPQRSTFAQN